MTEGYNICTVCKHRSCPKRIFEHDRNLNQCVGYEGEQEENESLIVERRQNVRKPVYLPSEHDAWLAVRRHDVSVEWWKGDYKELTGMFVRVRSGSVGIVIPILGNGSLGLMTASEVTKSLLNDLQVYCAVLVKNYGATE